MLFKIVSFLLDIAVGLLAGACLLRLFMQYQRIPFGNPVGRFVFALTDWIVVPLRRVLPAVRGIDTASLVAAYLLQVARFLVLWAFVGGATIGAMIPWLALFALAQLVIGALIGLMIIYAILSWVRADSPVVDIIERVCAPLLRPFRKVIPLVGGVDLSPMALLVVLYILNMILWELARMLGAAALLLH